MADKFKFVDLSSNINAKEKQSRRTEIRRHVMKPIGMQRRRRDQKQQQEQTKDSTLRDIAIKTFDEDGFFLDSTDTFSMKATSPPRSLPSWGSFPISGDDEVLELVRFANEIQEPYVPFRAIWFQVSLCDAGAFHVTMGNASNTRFTLCGNSPTDGRDQGKEAVDHYTSAIMTLRSRLGNSTDSVSEGVIANVLALVCFNFHRGNKQTWTMHMDGLRAIHKARRGFQDLSSDLQLFILLYDLYGSMYSDTRPLFPLPSDMLDAANISMQHTQPALQTFILQLDQMGSTMANTCRALQMVSAVAESVNLNSHSASFWRKDRQAMALIGPCIHHLLSMPRLPHDYKDREESAHLVMTELVRLVCLLMLSRLQGLFGFDVLEKIPLQDKVTQLVLEEGGAVLQQHQDLSIWIIITAALLHDSRDMMWLLVQLLPAETLSDCIQRARQTLWIGILESSAADDLESQLEIADIRGKSTCI